MGSQVNTEMLEFVSMAMWDKESRIGLGVSLG